MSQFKTKEFLALKKKWDKKLKSDGFEDIEQDDGNLKLWSSHFFKARFNETLFGAKEEYYRLAGQFLHEHIFKEQKTKLIWQLHSEGISIRDIVKALKKRGFKAYKNAVHRVVQDLTEQMLKKAGQNEQE